MVREACLPRSRPGPAADDRGGRGAVVRRAERPREDDRTVGREEPRDRVDPRHLEHLAVGERRQDPGKTPGEHRLPGSRRPGEEQVVAAGGRELERPPRTFLPAHVGEVRHERLRRRCLLVARLPRRQLDLAREVPRGLRQMAHRHRLDARERDLRRRLLRAEHASETRAPRAFRHGQCAADGPDAAVERELTQRCVQGEQVARHLPGCRENRERDREVEAGPLLAQARRREVDRDPAAGPVPLRRRDPAADALLRLLAGAVGQPDDREGGDAAADVGLHLDATGVEADDGVGDRAREHPADGTVTPRTSLCRIRAGSV